MIEGLPPRPPNHAAPQAEAPLLRSAPGGAAGHRKKAACVRSWLVVDSSGQAQVVEAEKHAIMRRTGLPPRDLRILDPVLSYPSTVLGRERAIVVNLEHIKAIITAQEILFLNSSDPLVTRFVKKLQGIIIHRQAVMSPKEAGVEGNSTVLAQIYDLQEPQLAAVGPQESHTNTFVDKNEEGNADGEQHVAENAHSLKLLPFEFVALEACLEAACSSLDDEARRLEQEAHPTLDKLTSQISTLNLERVRQIKSRLVVITGRVQKVRDELEHLLDDDEDMAEMYLTEKLEQKHLENSSVSSISDLDDMAKEVVLPKVENATPAEIIMGHKDSAHLSETDIQEIDNQNERIIGEPNPLRRDSHRTVTSMHSTNGKNLDVEELEMILEAYFVQIEGTLNKLSTLREYVDDTEDYINIMLDDKQNHLLHMGVILTTATVAVSAFVALTGVFGMNITIELFEDVTNGMPRFLWTVVGSTIGCVFLFVVAIACMSSKMFWNES